MRSGSVLLDQNPFVSLPLRNLGIEARANSAMGDGLALPCTLNSGQRYGARNCKEWESDWLDFGWEDMVQW
jgi:hypothetical protein